MDTFRTRIQQAADTFVNAVCDIISTATLEDIAEMPLQKRATALPRLPRVPAKAKKAALPKGAAPKLLKGGRLPRRTPTQIEGLVDNIVALLKKKGAMRSEHIREELGMQPKEMPKLLKQGLKAKVLKSKGVRRATEYTAVS